MSQISETKKATDSTSAKLMYILVWALWIISMYRYMRFMQEPERVSKEFVADISWCLAGASLFIARTLIYDIFKKQEELQQRLLSASLALFMCWSGTFSIGILLIRYHFNIDIYYFMSLSHYFATLGIISSALAVILIIFRQSD